MFHNMIKLLFFLSCQKYFLESIGNSQIKSVFIMYNMKYVYFEEYPNMSVSFMSL